MTEPACWVAAWPSTASAAALQAAGVSKPVHLTTYFNQAATFEFSVPWQPAKSAVIRAISAWEIAGRTYLVAELDCPWSADINRALSGLHGQESIPHNPHLTLEKNSLHGAASKYQQLVGMRIEFDRHGVPPSQVAAPKPQANG
jgi:hypothetical protein